MDRRDLALSPGTALFEHLKRIGVLPSEMLAWVRCNLRVDLRNGRVSIDLDEYREKHGDLVHAALLHLAINPKRQGVDEKRTKNKFERSLDFFESCKPGSKYLVKGEVVSTKPDIEEAPTDVDGFFWSIYPATLKTKHGNGNSQKEITEKVVNWYKTNAPEKGSGRYAFAIIDSFKGYDGKPFKYEYLSEQRKVKKALIIISTDEFLRIVMNNKRKTPQEICEIMLNR